MSDLIFTFDSTFDGFLTAVYHAVKNRLRPVKIFPEGAVQTCLQSEILFIPTDIGNADTVRRTLFDKCGYECFRRAYYVFLSSDKDAATASYIYILYALKHGRRTLEYMAVPEILNACKLERKVSYEAERMKGFLRFAVMEGGVEYAPMEPENDILVLLMPHFADKLKHIPFVIHDLARQKAGVYAKGSWFISDAEGLTPPPISSEEAAYRRLWKNFYSAISISQRKNEKLQTQMMPKKYRKHITECNIFD